MNGAEKLLGKGDMLFYPQGYTKPVRVQGAFVSDKEVSDVVEFLKNQQLGNIYDSDIQQKMESMGAASGDGAGSPGGGNERDQYFVDAAQFIIEKVKHPSACCSVSLRLVLTGQPGLWISCAKPVSLEKKRVRSLVRY